MARALSGLGQVKSLSENLHERLMEHNTELQLTGGTFAQSLTELHQLQRTQTAVNASQQVQIRLVHACMTLLTGNSCSIVPVCDQSTAALNQTRLQH